MGIETETDPTFRDGTEATVDARRRLLHLDRALHRLSETGRAAFLLHYGAGLRVTEVAAATGASPQTVWARIRSARERVLRAIPVELREAV